MLKKLFIFFMMFAWIPFTNVNANVRDPENLIVQNWQYTVQGFPGELLTTFSNGSFAGGLTNDLKTIDGRQADYLQIFWPYHPNLGLQVFPANDSTNPQASIIYFNTGGSVGTAIQMTTLFTTNTTTSSIRRTNGGYSTVIQVPRNAQHFSIVLYANTETVGTLNQIQTLLDEQFSVQLVSDPNFLSYPFNDFEIITFPTNFVRSLNNPIPNSAVREMILFINNYYERFTDGAADSYIVFKNSNNATLQTIELYLQKNIPEPEGYYVFNLDTTTLTNATKFDLYIGIDSTTGIAALLEDFTNSMYYNFDDQIYYAYYYSNLQLIDKRPFSLYAFDLEGALLPLKHSEWKWINPLTQERETYNFSIIPNQDIYLYSELSTSIIVDPTLPDNLGGVNNPLDTILINTGFFNAGGMMLIYFIIVMAIAIVVWKYQLSTMIAIIINILITGIFMFLGYMPLFASILLISFYIVAIIGINKGGLFSE
jgi:hypothetical protein